MNSFISWIGGKRQLRNQILEYFPEKETSNTLSGIKGKFIFCISAIL